MGPFRQSVNSRVFGIEWHHLVVVGIRTKAELAGLGVQGEVLEIHRTEECGAGSLTVEDILI